MNIQFCLGRKSSPLASFVVCNMQILPKTGLVSSFKSMLDEENLEDLDLVFSKVVMNLGCVR